MPKQEVISIQAYGRCTQKKTIIKPVVITSSELREFIRPYPLALLLFINATLFYIPILHKGEQFQEIRQSLIFILAITYLEISA